MSVPKVYIPKSKAKAQQTTFGDVLKLGFHAATLIDFIQKNQNASGYFNVDIVPRRETDQYGNTHSCVLNSWVPNASAPPKGQGTALKHTNPNDKPEEDDCPY